jgi:dTDP-4-dehydrorhamnose reductase
MKIAITGTNGLVGSRVTEILQNNFEIKSLTRDKIDITDKEKVESVLKKIDFDILIHLAAYTNVDKAEEERSEAYKINVDGTENIFQAVEKLEKKLIYVSTDFVFNGKNKEEIYLENSKPDPINYYGETKYLAEKVLKNKAMIVRISYPYGISPANKKDFIRTLEYLMSQKKELTMVTDSIITPTYIDDIAFSLQYLIDNYSPEILHICGPDNLSPYEAGIIIAEEFGHEKSLVKKTTYSDYFKCKAQRPQFSQMGSKKNIFYKMTSLKEGLKGLKTA